VQRWTSPQYEESGAPRVGDARHLPDLAVRLRFEDVYHAYFRQTVAWMRGLGVPEAEIEDVAQDVFMIVRRKLPHFHGGNLAGWLYRIAHLTVRNFRRKAWFKNLFSRRREFDSVELLGMGATPAMALETKQDQRVLAQMLDRMSDKRRSTLVLYEIEGYSGQEIATLHGVPVKTVWTRLHHARKDLVAMVAALRKQREAEAGRP
jgi:RNA polymerase sigma-70 factor (ECF subfamily)